MFNSFLFAFLKFILIIFLIIFVVFFVFFSIIFFNCMYLRIFKKMKREKNNIRVYKEKSVFYRIFVEFPRIFSYDYLNKKVNCFNEFGLHIIVGKQGCGKTLLMSYLIKKYKYMYPNLTILTNFEHKLQDFPLYSLKDLTLNRREFGELVCIDELQNYCDANLSKKFPVSLLNIITQQRKAGRCILATTQNFCRLSKQLRENTYLLYEPLTFLNCITFVRVYEPILSDDAQIIKRNKVDSFFFVHSKELREMYDTYKFIDSSFLSSFD